MLVDLNVPWPQESFDKPITEEALKNLLAILSTLHLLKYTHVALNFTVNQSDKFPNKTTELNPMRLEERFGEFMRSTGMKLYSRLTLQVDDPSRGQPISKIAQQYDIVAIMPLSERALTLATTSSSTSSLDIDLLTFDYGKRLPALLKHKAMCACVKRGVKVEIVYGYALRDTQQRSYFVSGVRSVIRSCRGRGIVVSSGAKRSLECRNVLGVNALLKSLGLSSDKCSKAMGELASLVLLNGRLRTKSYKQTVVVGGGDVSVVDDLEGISEGKNIKVVKRSLSLVDSEPEQEGREAKRLKE